MANYSTSAAINDILSRSKEPGFPREEVLSYLQNTQDEVLGRWRFKFSEARETKTLEAAHTSLELPEGSQQVVQLVLSHADMAMPTVMTYLPNVDFFERYPSPESEGAGEPFYYTDYAGTLYFERPANKGYTVGIRYIKASHRLTDSVDSVPQIPEEFREILLRGGLAGIEEYRENFDLAAIHQRRIELLSEDMLGRYGLRKMQPGRVRPMQRTQSRW